MMGKKALKLAKENAYDMILLDIMLPSMMALKCASRSGNFPMFR